ncbi:MAG: hypothetical protein DRR06_05790 [Gammaproteobacteria bacterium]|nr:MAG: hypothetical protein DRR06_05790 [Gammaproteobacteria bacterium]RLA49865.1 MAG: hypothetical protein DRR42_14635 [Gammaproteobacteria bacterium]
MPESWYESVLDNSLEQGDLLYEFPIVKADVTAEHVQQILAGEEPDIGAEVVLINAIILTQSCDLQNDKTETVILCPLWDDENGQFGKNKMNEIRAGRRFGWHLLNRDEAQEIPFTVVEFSRLFMAKRSAVVQFISNGQSRPRLLSPYKEHLSQAFARYFMRVGLPSDIPKF